MNKSRKLAWVVLGVVVSVSVGFFVWLSILYSPWDLTTYGSHDGRLGTMRWSHSLMGQNNNFRSTWYGKTRHQRFRWMPGEDVVSILITHEEWLELKMRAKQ